jgi:hypothetical protein
MPDQIPADFNVPYLPIRRFAAATNSSVGKVRRLLNNGKLHAVHDGLITKIVETPSQYLAFLPPYLPGEGGMKAGPGRGLRGPWSEHARNLINQPA